MIHDWDISLSTVVQLNDFDDLQLRTPVSLQHAHNSQFLIISTTVRSTGPPNDRSRPGNSALISNSRALTNKIFDFPEWCNDVIFQQGTKP